MSRAIVIVTYGEVLTEAFAKLVEAFQNLYETIIDKWDEIKQFFVEGQEKLDDRDCIRDTWEVPLKIMKANQVLNRKPVVCRARSYC